MSALHAEILPIRGDRAATPNVASPIAGLVVPPAPTTVRELVARYLEEAELKYAAGLIGSALLRRLRRHLKDFSSGSRGDLAAERIRGTDVTHWILGHQAWLSDHTRAHAARTLQGAWLWALDEADLITRNPIRRLKPCWDPPQPRGAISADEYRRVLDAARQCSGKRRSGRRACPSRHAFRVALWFLWETGCRTCEMREARWDQIDWDAGLLKMDRHKTVRRTGRPRVIPLTDRVLRLLRWLYRRRRPDQVHVLVAGRGMPWTCGGFGALMLQFAQRAGVRAGVTAYCLRHGFTVEGLRRREGERQLADVLGHTSTKYVSWYGQDVRLEGQYLRDIAGRVHGHVNADADGQGPA